MMSHAVTASPIPGDLRRPIVAVLVSAGGDDQTRFALLGGIRVTPGLSRAQRQRLSRAHLERSQMIGERLLKRRSRLAALLICLERRPRGHDVGMA